MHQELEYLGRIEATDFRNQYFVELVCVYDSYGETITETDEFTAAFLTLACKSQTVDH